METTSTASAHVAVVVRQPMNEHGTMTVEVADTNETRHLVDYATSRIRSTLSALPAGTTIPLELVRVGVRSNVWRVVALAPSRQPETGAESSRPSETAGEPEPPRVS